MVVTELTSILVLWIRILVYNLLNNPTIEETSYLPVQEKPPSSTATNKGSDTTGARTNVETVTGLGELETCAGPA